MCFSLRYNGFPEGQELPKASLADWIEMMGGGRSPCGKVTFVGGWTPVSWREEQATGLPDLWPLCDF